MKIRDPIEVWWPRLELDSRFISYYTDKESGININANHIPVIHQFDGTENGFLSNFFPYPIHIYGLDYQTTEHYYQSMKAEPDATIEMQRNIPLKDRAIFHQNFVIEAAEKFLREYENKSKTISKISLE